MSIKKVESLTLIDWAINQTNKKSKINWFNLMNLIMYVVSKTSGGGLIDF